MHTLRFILFCMNQVFVLLPLLWHVFVLGYWDVDENITKVYRHLIVKCVPTLAKNNGLVVLSHCFVFRFQCVLYMQSVLIYKLKNVFVVEMNTAPFLHKIHHPWFKSFYLCFVSINEICPSIKSVIFERVFGKSIYPSVKYI